jgi:hypothetical protein
VAFSIKAWLDRFGSGGSFDQPTDTGATPTTPVDAAGLRDMETRLSGYTDSREAAEISARNTAISTHSVDTTAVHGITDTAALATSASVTSAVAAEATARNTAISAAISAQGDLATQAELDAHVNDTTAAHAATAVSVTPFGPIASTNVQDALEEIVAEAGGGGSQPALTSTGTTANFGTTLTVDFGSTAREKRYSGTLNGNLAVTVQNPVAGSMLVIEGAQDGTGGRTLTVAGQSVTIPSTASAPVSVEIRWYDATTFRVVSAGVETDATATTAINNHIADTTAAHAAGSISYNGSTNLSATDVEAALDELDTEKADKSVSVNAQTGTSYTLVLADASKLVTVSNAATHTLTVPQNSSVAFPVGTVINIARIGAGAVNVAAGTGATVNSPGSVLGLRVQYSQATLIKTATNTWLLGGDIA